jgi:ATP-dependent helicase/nuclease subunit B
LLRAAEAALGCRVSADGLLELAEAGETALGRPHPLEAGASIDLLERDLALVAGGQAGAACHLTRPDSFVTRSLERHAAHRSAQLTPFDGIVDVTTGAPLLGKIAVAQDARAATVLEVLGQCPYRYLLQRGFGLWPWDEPDRAYQLEGKDYGGIFHNVMEALLTELHDEGVLPLDDAGLERALARARELLDAELKRVRETGEIVHPALLEPTAARLWGDLDETLLRETRQAGEWTPGAFEVRFQDVPFDLGGGKAVSFNGKIDRIDFAADPDRLRVVDYKTGGFFWRKTEQFKGGRALQLPIYNLAAGHLYPRHEVEAAEYYHCTAGAGFRRHACPNSDENREILRKVLVTLDDVVATGTLAPDPDENNCRYCDYKDICGPDREHRAQRKSADARIAAFKALREIP